MAEFSQFFLFGISVQGYALRFGKVCGFGNKLVLNELQN